MKLIRGAMIGAATFALVAAPTVALAGDASKLSLRATTKSSKSSKQVPVIPSWIAITAVAGIIGGVVVLSTQSPDSP
ncbi:MAG: hypothetical protein EOP62_03380 [Sphingomonadales bacterium]|nr:MAG: hypothetical protein EOP62_03380 [Sphingomonadales bacterium]